MPLFGRNGAGSNGQQRDYGDVGWPLFPPRDPGNKANVGWRNALTIPTVWACVMLRADMVSSMPVKTYTKRRNTDGSMIETQVANPALIEAPSAELAFDEWQFASQVSLDLRGNSYGIIVDRDKAGRPTQVELQHPDTVNVREEKDGSISYTIGGIVYSTKNGKARDIWHERQFVTPGSVVGMSVIQNFARTLRIPIAAEMYGDGWFSEGAHPTGILSNRNIRTLEDGVADTIKRRFLAQVQGKQEPVVLSGGWDWTSIQISPSESQFLETQGFSANQIARLWRIPATMLDLETGSSMTYTNVENRGLQFLTYSMGPTFTRRARALQQCSPANQYSRFDTTSLLATDRLTEARTQAILIAAKVLAQDEVREGMGREPLTEAQIEQIQMFNVAMAKRVSDSEDANSGAPTDPTDVEGAIP